MWHDVRIQAIVPVGGYEFSLLRGSFPPSLSCSWGTPKTMKRLVEEPELRCLGLAGSTTSFRQGSPLKACGDKLWAGIRKESLDARLRGHDEQISDMRL